jgi:hypothetical protein
MRGEYRVEDENMECREFTGFSSSIELHISSREWYVSCDMQFNHLRAIRR